MPPLDAQVDVVQLDAIGYSCCYGALMSGCPVATKIYIGAPVDQESERKVLASIIQRLEERQIPFTILGTAYAQL